MAYWSLRFCCSALHSYLIVRFARTDGASLDIGFYYMANAGGRLAGTIASGAFYQLFGLQGFNGVDHARVINRCFYHKSRKAPPSSAYSFLAFEVRFGSVIQRDRGFDE